MEEVGLHGQHAGVFGDVGQARELGEIAPGEVQAAGLVCLGADAGLIRGDLCEVRGSDAARPWTQRPERDNWKREDRLHAAPGRYDE